MPRIEIVQHPDNLKGSEEVAFQVALEFEWFLCKLLFIHSAFREYSSNVN